LVIIRNSTPIKDGFSIVDISIPHEPKTVGFVLSPVPDDDSNGNIWRDIRVVNDVAYIGSEVDSHGIQIFDLARNGTGILKCWVDASFAVHPNMRGHSRGGLSLGRGFPIVSSTSQQINTHSSTETEIVGADDFIL
jgi:hypothetical protein